MISHYRYKAFTLIELLLVLVSLEVTCDAPVDVFHIVQKAQP